MLLIDSARHKTGGSASNPEYRLFRRFISRPIRSTGLLIGAVLVSRP